MTDTYFPGGTAKQIFDRAQLPNDILVRIWNLADTEQRGMLNVTEFIIAMHLLASYKIGALRALPQTLPPGLYEAAARRGAPPRPVSGSRPASEAPSMSAVPRQFSGAVPQRTSSPLARGPYGSPTQPAGSQLMPGGWTITPQEKARFDGIFSKVDTENRGSVTGEQAVGFFSNSRLPEDDLALIWDLADVNSEGQLNREEFAVAMYLIQQQLAKKGPIPQSLPQSLIPPSRRQQSLPPQQSAAPVFNNAANITKPKSAVEDLFGLDDFSTPAAQVSQSTGDSTTFTPSSSQATTSPLQPQYTSQQQTQPNSFKAFVPSSSFGQTMMTPQATGTTASTAPLEQTRGIHQQPRWQATNIDDLLGDNDPEISKRLTQETSELANMSNQVGTLTSQMQEVKTKRASTEQDFSQVNSQKRDFEARLSQLRSAYEQEVRDVKALEERLSMSRNDSKKVQQDLAMVQHTQQNLQAEHQQITSTLEADQRENASLKERMRQVNDEINQLKPQLEKMRSDARQQKGLVAINKKQLSALEAERDRFKMDFDGATRELDEAKNEAAGTKRGLEAASQTQTPVPVASSATSSQSTNPFFKRTTTASEERGMSQSPFTPQAATSPNHNAFDSFFGPSFTTAAHNETNSMSSGDPPTSFGGEANASVQSKSNTIPANFSISEPVTETGNDLPLPNELPPPPPQSRQITSSFLPFRDNRERSGSPNSSIGVAAPAGRFGDFSGFATPTNEREMSEAFSQPAAPVPKKEPELKEPELDASRSGSPFPERKSSLSTGPNSRRPSAIGTAGANSDFEGMGQRSVPPDVPGSFPGDSTPFHTPLNSSTHSEESPIRGLVQGSHSTGQVVEPKDEKSKLTTSPAPNRDLGPTFLSYGNHGSALTENDKGLSSSGTATMPQPATHGEFPPIQEFGAEDDSESDYSDHGFEDSFSPVTSRRQQAHAIHEQGDKAGFDENTAGRELTDRPAPARTDNAGSHPPAPDAQNSPPTYNQTVSPNTQPNAHRDSNQFPAEYSGLLPSREKPTPPTPPSKSAEAAIDTPLNTNGNAGSSFFGGVTSMFSGSSQSTGNNASGVLGGVSSFFGRSPPTNNDANASTSQQRSISETTLPPSQMPMAPGSTAAPFAYDNDQAAQSQAQYSQEKPSIAPKSAFDDFDNEFSGLSEAHVADDKGDDDFASSTSHGFDEFNPAFDSPAPSKGTNSSIIHGSNAFHDFESSISGPSQASSSKLVPPASTDHDWDAIFAGMDGSSAGNGSSATNGMTQPSIPPKESFPIEESPTTYAPPPGPPPSQKSQLARAMTAGTEHDDPILKRLTGMGYPRDESLSALEKFDYNLDKVRTDSCVTLWGRRD